MGRHRNTGRRRGVPLLIIAGVAALVSAVALVVWWLAPDTESAPSAETAPSADAAPSATVTAAETAAPECGDRQSLRIVAATSAAELIEAAPIDECIDVDVTIDNTAAPTAALLAGEVDIWIPDSRARAAALGSALAEAPTVALSPLVIAADAQTAALLAPEGISSWGVLLQRTQGQFEMAMQPPQESSAALLVAQAMQPPAQAILGDVYLGYAGIAATLKGIPAFAGNDPGVGEVLVVEQRLLPEQATPIPTAEGYPALDFPWLIAPAATPEVSAAAERVLGVLVGEEANAARAAVGLLDPDTTDMEVEGVPGQVLGNPKIDELPLLYALADAGGQRGYGTIVVDISGSMGRTDSAGGPSRIDAVKDSMQLAISVLADDTLMGLWAFGNDLDGTAEHLELVPHGPMVETRSAFAAQMQPFTADYLKEQDHGTALYNVVRDAFADAVANWQPNHNNLVIVFTDGTNEDAADSLDIAGLESALADLADPARPVQVVLFAYGEADVAALERIAAASGQGMVYPIASTEQIVGVLIDAIARSVLSQLQAS